ncbi:hypothetical protein [Nitriliruptor alkaliphilus]|uniref:hypothetical protein n=1 Tax=Nitriliruptor alkaliphilus TaxID=427918 RepID=UPI0012EEC224|nr:hypothetical protein [Nitriliruptor alkaliphilus]
MDDAPAATLARHDALLTLLADTLTADERGTRLIGPDEGLPVPTLLVALGADDEGRDRTMGITILPFDEGAFDATDLMQFYVRMPFEVPDGRRTEVMAATAMVNASMAVGHFAVRGDELYYRYVLALPNNAVADEDMFGELVALLAFHQETFGDYFEGVVDGEIPLALLPDVLEQTA